MKLRLIFLAISAVLLCSCSKNVQSVPQTIRIVSWGGIGAAKADTLFSLAKECGFDTHLGLYSTQENAVLSMDAAARAGVGIIINFPQLKDSTESAVAFIKDHPALVAYHIKDEPELDDFEWLKALQTKISSLDAEHPCYINLLPNWSWGVEEYRDNIERFASEFDVPFYSFDNYPIVEKDGEVEVRSDWYRNLEEFSAMARSHGKPFWAFALAKAHCITEPQVAVYPEPTLGHLRLQVFSNLLYGAQAIQYFNFTGIVDPATCEKKPAFDLIRQVNSEVRAYSSVFAGCTVLDVWHTGESIPSGTVSLAAMPDGMPHERVKSLRVSGEGAVVSLIVNGGETGSQYQYKDRYTVPAEDVKAATLDMDFQARYGLAGALEIWVSKSFEGLNGADGAADRAAIQAMVDGGMQGWTKLDYQEGASTKWTEQVFDLSEYVENFCIAFHWCPPQFDQTQRTYWINGKLSLDLAGTDPTVMDISELAFTTVMMNEQIEDPYKKNAGNGSIILNNPNTGALIFQGVGGNALDYCLDGWAISKPAPLNRVANDKATVIKNMQNYMTTYEYTWTKPGTYNVTFVGTNESYVNATSQIKEMTVTIVENLQ